MIKNEKTSMDGLLSRYEDTLNYSKFCLQDVDVVLKPEEIDEFLQSTVMHAEERGYSKVTGPFINKLIQNSYDAGHNGFKLDTYAAGPLKCLGERLHGSGSIPLRLEVEGPVGDLFGFFSKNLSLSIKDETVREDPSELTPTGIFSSLYGDSNFPAVITSSMILGGLLSSVVYKNIPRKRLDKEYKMASSGINDSWNVMGAAVDALSEETGSMLELIEKDYSKEMKGSNRSKIILKGILGDSYGVKAKDISEISIRGNVVGAASKALSEETASMLREMEEDELSQMLKESTEKAREAKKKVDEAAGKAFHKFVKWNKK
ncbi:MAG: hypothetical protein ABIB71_03645 [Candidatus Woesearchaeota archaeon]